MPVLRHHVSPQLEFLTSGFYRLLDLELTCWPGSLQRVWSAPDEYREIVQCGFIDFEYSSRSNTIIVAQAVEYLVCPALNPVLSDYFTDLTGISNEMLARDAVSFESIFSSISDKGRTLLANGDDVEILNENAMIHDFPFVALHGFDLRPFLSTLLGLEIADCMSSDLPLLVEGCSPPGRAHQALNDCWCLLQALAVGLSCELIDQSCAP